MRLTSAQHSQIAAAYERAAEDEKLPPQPRAGFAKKAQWFRMLAQVAEAKEAAIGESADSCPDAHREPLLSVGFLVELLNRREQVASSERRPTHQFTNDQYARTYMGESGGQS
jgi:hypothetical protein